MEPDGDIGGKAERVHVHTIRAMELEAHRTRASMQLLRQQLEESYEEIATMHGKNHRLKVRIVCASVRTCQNLVWGNAPLDTTKKIKETWNRPRIHPRPEYHQYAVCNTLVTPLY